MKRSPSQSLEPPLIYRNVWTVEASSSKKDHPQDAYFMTSSFSEATELEAIKNELKKIGHLMNARAHKEEEQRYEDDREDETRNDWMLAAAVLDRICAIVITVIFVAGTITLFVIFAVHHS